MSENESGAQCGRQHQHHGQPPGYIIVKEEYEDEPLELELENDGNLRMSTLISQFRHRVFNLIFYFD